MYALVVTVVVTEDRIHRARAKSALEQVVDEGLKNQQRSAAQSAAGNYNRTDLGVSNIVPISRSSIFRATTHQKKLDFVPGKLVVWVMRHQVTSVDGKVEPGVLGPGENRDGLKSGRDQRER